MSATLDTEKADVLTGLIRRDGGRYSTRRIIPLDLRPAYGGKREIVRALGTTDPAEARRLHVALWATLDQEFTAARASLLPAEPKVEVGADAGVPAIPEIMDINAYAARALAGLRKKRAKYIAAGKIDQFNAEADDSMWVYDNTIKYGDFTGLSVAEAEGMRIATRAILTGEGAAALATISNSPSSMRAAGPTLSLSDLVARWAKEREPQPRSVKDIQRSVRRFESVVGALSVQDVGKKHIIAFKDALLAEGKTPKNINVIIPFLGTIFNFAVDNGLIEANPAKGVQVLDKARSSEKRRGFNKDELAALFSGPVHSEGVRPIGGGGEAAYWLPLLSLYTGARQTELGQLHPEDVCQERYDDLEGNECSAWVVRIVENKSRGQKVKTEGSERRVPLHRDLIRLGFLEVVADARTQGRERIFYSIKAASSGELMGNWSKWFGRYIRKTCMMTDRRVVFHSFRHSFKDLARACMLDTAVHNAITGHETGDVADKYGSLDFPLGPLVDAIDRYRIPGLVLPPPPRG